MSLPNPPTVACQCQGHPLASGGCVCPQEERALRAWKADKINRPMTDSQREWCLDEIARVEGYDRRDYEGETSGQIANGVLSAWTDYCRDKGLL